MKIVRYIHADVTRYGVMEDGKVREIQGDLFADNVVLGKAVDRSKIKLLHPCVPSKIVAIGLNYKDHAEEMGKELPGEPLLFLKPSTAALPPEGVIHFPPMAGRVDYEAELAVVVRKTASRITEAQAKDHILGYTCFNDVTARDLQTKDVQYTRAKGFDTFAPFGPCIVTDLDTKNLRIESFLNGEKRQSSSTEHLIFRPEWLVAYISQIMTLEAGDVIATGTPGGIGAMQPGDTIEVIVEGIGTLKNTVAARPEKDA